MGGTDEAPPSGEFEFLGGDDGAAPGEEGRPAGEQTLAPATEEQAAATAAARSANAALESAETGREPEPLEGGEDAPMPDAAPELGAEEPAAAAPEGATDGEPQSAREKQRRGAGANREAKAPTAEPFDGIAAPLVDAEPHPADIDTDAQREADARGDAALVAVRLERATLADEDDAAAATPLSEQELAALREDAEASLAEWRATAGAEQPDAAERAAALWARFEALTAPLASELCEQLRLILEPTLAARMQGDYRTGKRLNMRKIIPYLASDFRRDKIWLRRSKPSVRRYQARLRAAVCVRALGSVGASLRRAFRSEDINCPIAILLPVRIKHNPLRSTERNAGLR